MRVVDGTWKWVDNRDVLPVWMWRDVKNLHWTTILEPMHAGAGPGLLAHGEHGVAATVIQLGHEDEDFAMLTRWHILIMPLACGHFPATTRTTRNDSCLDRSRELPRLGRRKIRNAFETLKRDGSQARLAA